MPFGAELEAYRIAHERENPDALATRDRPTLADEQLVADWAWSRPNLGALRYAGYIGAMRYLARIRDAKLISADEKAAIIAVLGHLGLVWETTADRAGQGWDAGWADAVEANNQADALGWDAPIYYAVDFDADPDQVRPYFDGVLAARRRAAGVYGGYRVIEGLADIVPYRWQTVAWSGGQISALAHLYQRYGHPSGGPDDDYDENVKLADDWGQSPRPGPPVDPDPFGFGDRTVMRVA